jgi:hypothetical protein
MKQTKMSASQITIWFTNARVKMRKENKLTSKNGKKKKKKQQDDLNHSNELILSDEEISPSNIFPYKQFVLAYSCLNTQQIVCYKKKEMFYNKYKISFRLIFIVSYHSIRINCQYRIV